MAREVHTRCYPDPRHFTRLPPMSRLSLWECMQYGWSRKDQIVRLNIQAPLGVTNPVRVADWLKHQRTGERANQRGRILGSMRRNVTIPTDGCVEGGIAWVCTRTSTTQYWRGLNNNTYKSHEKRASRRQPGWLKRMENGGRSRREDRGSSSLTSFLTTGLVTPLL